MKTKLEEISEVELIRDNFLNGTYIISGRKKSKSNTLSALKYHLKQNGYSSDILFFVFNPPPICKICKNRLTINDISYGRQYVYPKCCKQCISTKEYLKIPCSKETKNKISASNKKWAATKEGKLSHKKQGIYNSRVLKEFYKTDKGKSRIEEMRIHNSECMLRAIRNGAFTPNITNTWTHWNAIVKIEGIEYKFRSSWEACFYLSNKHLKYEYIRIPYKLNGKDKTYIADFYDCNNNIIYEIKPKRSYYTQKQKIECVMDYCVNNNITFIWINEDNILDYINENDIIDENKKQYDKMIKGVGAKK